MSDFTTLYNNFSEISFIIIFFNKKNKPNAKRQAPDFGARPTFIYNDLMDIIAQADHKKTTSLSTCGYQRE